MQLCEDPAQPETNKQSLKRKHGVAAWALGGGGEVQASPSYKDFGAKSRVWGGGRCWDSEEGSGGLYIYTLRAVSGGQGAAEGLGAMSVC